MAVMSHINHSRSKANCLAVVIEQDLRRRNLSVGDPYLTAIEAGNNFGADQTTATRALSLLAKRGMLIRKRGAGTFVGHMEAEAPVSALRTVHVLKGPMKDGSGWSSSVGEFVQGLHDAMPKFQVQSNILPRDNPAERAHQILMSQIAGGSLAGILLLSCPREVQEFVLELRLPAVSYGCVYSTTRSLLSFDQDQFESGRLQAEYLLKRGHRRIVLLMRDLWRPGDNRMAEGINHAMAEAGLAIGSLSTRSIPEEETLIRKEIHRILSINDRPTGMICRSARFAEIALAAVRSHSMSVPEDLDIVFSHHNKSDSEGLRLPQVCPQITYSEHVTLVTQTLCKLISGEQPENRNIRLAVELVGPEQT